MDGVIRVNVTNIVTVGIIALVFVFMAKYAAKTWAPSMEQYI